MTPEVVVDIGREAMHVTMMLSSPLLLPALAIGLFMGAIQAATQIQEMTLSFIPKLIGLAFALLFAASWMLRTLVEYTQQLFAAIPGLLG